MTEDPSEHPEGHPEGRLRPLSGGVLAVCATVGLVGGWLVHRVADRLGETPPVVTWSQGIVLALLAGVLALVARATSRTLEEREPVEAYRMVNRLVLARASALVGALAAGGYAGYAISWLGDGSDMVGTRLLTAALAALGGLLFLAAALWLERACRVRSDGEES